MPSRRDGGRRARRAGVRDELATGLPAGANPVYGFRLNAYLVGTITGAAVTSSAFMAAQGTGAMAMVVAGVPAVDDAGDPARALFTLAVVTSVVMILAGLLRLDSVLRFVPNAVMLGFISAVGANIVLGATRRLHRLRAEGANSIIRAVDTLMHIGRLHLTPRASQPWTASSSSSPLTSGYTSSSSSPGSPG